MESKQIILDQVTEDFFYKGKVKVYQNKKGYRFSIDAPILADFIPPSFNEALEIGTGCGIISLLLIYKKKFPFIHAVEIQEGLKKLAEVNIKENGFLNYIKVIEGDFKENYLRFKGIGEIFANPPFFATHKGKLSPVEEISIAKSEKKLSLEDLLIGVFEILGEKGNFFLILPYERYDDIKKISRQVGFYQRQLREICPYKDRKPNRFLIQLTNYRVSKVVKPPLILYQSLNCYSDEMEEIISG